MSRRVPVAFLLVAGLLAALAAPVAVAAGGPTLTATPIPGKEIDVSGSGFPADADVLLVIERNGAPDGSQTPHTDASGAFTATIDAGPGRGGSYTLVATSGSAKAVATVVAVETAGGGSGGVRPTPPVTATAGGAPTGTDRSGLLLASVLATGASLVVARRLRARRAGSRA